MKIRIKLIEGQSLPRIISKGEWIDLSSNEDITMIAPQAKTLRYKSVGETTEGYRNVVFSNYLIPLGVAMQLPKGYEAHIVPRSSTYNKFGVILANHLGVIDNSYCGNKDEWKFNAIALRETTISKGDRICQFRVELSQTATIWQRIKWLFTNKIEFIEVDNLNNTNRGGFGITGKKQWIE